MHTPWVKRVALFLVGQSITLFGSMLAQFAISWHITLTTQSGGMLAISTLVGFLPQVLIALFAGVWADRYNRKLLIILADSMIALFTLGLALIYSTGYQGLWPLFLISAVRSVGAGIQSPAVGAYLTELAPADQLMRVNGINGTIQNLMMLAAPVAAGALYAMSGVAPVFWVDVITAIIGTALLLMLRTPPREIPPSTGQHILVEMAEGARYVAKAPWLYQLLGFYLVSALLFGPVVFLTPLMVARSFGEEPWRLVVHELVFSVGGIAGGIWISAWGGFKNKSLTLIVGNLLFGLTTLIMGFSPNFWFYLAVMLPMGLTMPFIHAASNTILQTRTRPEMMGRVFSLVSIIFSGAMPLSMVAFGPLADVMRIELQLVITGALLTAASLYALRFKALRDAGAPDDNEPRQA